MTTSQTANLSIEERLAAMEAALAEIQKRLPESDAQNWVEKFSGSFEDEPEFEVVLAYGRAIRQGDYSVLEPIDEA
ncbi:MAG: hypothetical protein MUC48_02255 [Leptolyngbya sp. Prado105]|jgi:hypothetical protein|nr:hypothetical protein [Leptolyngbya sp. Prado105]